MNEHVLVRRADLSYLLGMLDHNVVNSTNSVQNAQDVIRALGLLIVRAIDPQHQVRGWAIDCFGQDRADDLGERLARFAEESSELLQSLGFTKDQAIEVPNYVYARPVGEPAQEIGGTMTTLVALAAAPSVSIDAISAFLTEVRRIQEPETVERIRAKNLTKPRF